MSTQARPMSEPRVVLDGLAYVESPRWHDGRLWFAHWGTDEIIAVDLDGRSEVVAHGPGGLGWSIDWLPDGRLLVTGAGLSREEPEGKLKPVIDRRYPLSQIVEALQLVEDRGAKGKLVITI